MENKPDGFCLLTRSKKNIDMAGLMCSRWVSVVLFVFTFEVKLLRANQNAPLPNGKVRSHHDMVFALDLECDNHSRPSILNS
jgi:hypothetical protein